VLVAAQLGFNLIYPIPPNQSNCGDMQNKASLMHGVGGDSALASSAWAISPLTSTALTASESTSWVSRPGGMTTNLLAGSYPVGLEAGGACSASRLAASSLSPLVSQVCELEVGRSESELAAVRPEITVLVSTSVSG
jgi:hypothetical protein